MKLEYATLKELSFIRPGTPILIDELDDNCNDNGITQIALFISVQNERILCVDLIELDDNGNTKSNIYEVDRCIILGDNIRDQLVVDHLERK
jgi:hypothetical protein